MQWVVSDAGPLHYLILIDCARVLESLFGRIHIPAAVQRELTHPSAPSEVRRWIAQPPAWLSVKNVGGSETLVRRLHSGEAEALKLASQLGSALVLMDDIEGRLCAKRLGLPVAGSIGLLEIAADNGFIDLKAEFEKLRQTNFFAAPHLFEAALKRDAARRARKRQ